MSGSNRFGRCAVDRHRADEDAARGHGRNSSPARSLIPELPAQGEEPPAAGPGALGMDWTSVDNARDPDANPLAVGCKPTSVSVGKPATADQGGYGFTVADTDYLGARGRGAFGTTLRSGLIWGRRGAHDVQTRARGRWRRPRAGILRSPRRGYTQSEHDASASLA